MDGIAGDAESPLHQLFDVVLHSPASAVRSFLVSHPDIDVEMQNEKGDTALLLAARRGDIEVVEALLHAPPGSRANVHTRNLKGSNALIAAAMKGHAEICRLLLDEGADVNQATDSSDTALSLAIWQNHTEVCIMLMNAGANVDNIDKFGDTMLLDAAKHGNVAVMRLLLEKQTLHIDHINKKGDTALIRAAWKGEVEAVQLLLDHDADPTIANKSGCTALIMSCMHNNRACARLLLEHGGSPINAVDDSGRSAFAYLALYTPTAPPANASPGRTIDDQPWFDGLMLMLEMHARIDTPPNVGNLLLCRAANINHIDLADLLLREGADINFADPQNKYRPPLLAHLQGAPDLSFTHFLLDQDPQPLLDLQDSDGHSGLMFAVKHNSPELVAALLNAPSPASVVIENRQGESAMDMCVQMIHVLHTNVQHLEMVAGAAAANQQANSNYHPVNHGGVGLIHATGVGAGSNVNIDSQLGPAFHSLSSPLLQARSALDRAQRCLQLLLAHMARELGPGALLLHAAHHNETQKLEEYLINGVRVNKKARTGGGTIVVEEVVSERDGTSTNAGNGNGVDSQDIEYERIDVNFTDKSGRSALMLAAKSNHVLCVKLLLQHGALLNLRDKDGTTALTMAIRCGARESAELLAETMQGHAIHRGGLPFAFHTPTFPHGAMLGNMHATGTNGTAGSQLLTMHQSPYQVAAEEFEQNTTFLKQLIEQMQQLLVHGKQAAIDAMVKQAQQRPASTIPGGVATAATTDISPHTLRTSTSLPSIAPAPSSLHMSAPLPSLPRSSSYVNSFPSPAPSPNPLLVSAPSAAAAAAATAPILPQPAKRPPYPPAAAGLTVTINHSKTDGTHHDEQGKTDGATNHDSSIGIHNIEARPSSSLSFSSLSSLPQMSPTSSNPDSTLDLLQALALAPVGQQHHPHSHTDA